VVSTPALLAPLAQTTGGGARRLEGSAGLHVPKIVDIRAGTHFSGEDYIGLKPTEASLLTGVTVAPLGLGFLGLALLLLPLILTWLVEGRRRRG
jgi:hypothetical protein